MRASTSDETPPPLDLSPEKVCYLIVKVREFDVKDAETEPDPGSNPADDKMYGVLEDHKDDPVVQEIVEIVNDLNEDEQNALVALYWLGRGDGTLKDWSNLRHEAKRAHNDRTADYLLGEPLLSDYLEEGLSQFGHSCEEYELGHL
ncbi:DUF3775 domain-containing protein [Minwuia thermotolerans]|uniref:DUF3775 domain-containing protein n=1 Tax=Minwuia thermotolerans TaxID=2056226 RepID=A0A2M9FVI9_9PROT|nr:DUF3775 domain-containing protein [Minwuia thermotolerans]PJK27453.1 hypothetical protein CVT23_21245 [Minwuia thermotolerans]